MSLLDEDARKSSQTSGNSKNATTSFCLDCWFGPDTNDPILSLLCARQLASTAATFCQGRCRSFVDSLKYEKNSMLPRGSTGSSTNNDPQGHVFKPRRDDEFVYEFWPLRGEGSHGTLLQSSSRSTSFRS